MGNSQREWGRRAWQELGAGQDGLQCRNRREREDIRRAFLKFYAGVPPSFHFEILHK